MSPTPLPLRSHKLHDLTSGDLKRHFTPIDHCDKPEVFDVAACRVSRVSVAQRESGLFPDIGRSSRKNAKPCAKTRQTRLTLSPLIMTTRLRVNPTTAEKMPSTQRRLSPTRQASPTLPCDIPLFGCRYYPATKQLGRWVRPVNSYIHRHQSDRALPPSNPEHRQDNWGKYNLPRQR